ISGNEIEDNFTTGEEHTVNRVGGVHAGNSGISVTPTNLVAGNNSTVSITLRDSNNNPIIGKVEGDFTIDLSGSAVIVDDTFDAGEAGLYTIEITNNVAEQIMVTVEADEIEIGTNEVTFTPGAA